MKAIKLPRELEPFLKAAEISKEETLVFTAKKKPVAALVSLKKVDRESLALSTNPDFLKIIEAARKEIRAGKVISLEEFERSLTISAHKKTLKRKPRRGAAHR
jgi:hypothetical protein